MTDPEKRYIRLTIIAVCIFYLAITPLFLVLKFTTSIFDAVGWLELIYGPAITCICSLALFFAGVWIERLIRRRE